MAASIKEDHRYADTFGDKVINPVIVDPVVQFTLYLKVKYDVVR